MISLAFSKLDFVEISNFELKRANVSYTFDTVSELRAECPDCDIVIIIGSDNYESLHTCHRICELINLSKFVVVMRPGYENDISNQYLYKIYPEKFMFLDDLKIDLSSSYIRNCVKTGAVDELTKYLDENVIHYILTRRLYEAVE